MKLNRKIYWLKLFCILFCGLLATPSAWPEAFNAPDCRSFDLGEQQFSGTGKYGKGLLWRVSKEGIPDSYIFGTIHLSDPEVTELPEQVSAALNESKLFVMEILPAADDVGIISKMMFFTDQRRLNSFLSEPLFNRTVDILRAYQMNSQAVSILKPWAAFLTMSYPPQTGIVLDLVLLQRAQDKEMALFALETLDEQLDIFSGLAMDDQVNLLKDTVCHYDLVIEGFDEMKRLYLQRDLKGLFIYNQKYSVPGDDIYDKLMDRLLTQRNYAMAERMQAQLRQGAAFIAIGAMHLPGNEGVLNLLHRKGYNISLAY